MKPNPGICPEEARGKRVKVRLRNGQRPANSWPADGPNGCRWSLQRHPFDIIEYEVE